MPRNLYVHFPFCRRKCAYCSLYSRAGSNEEELSRYVEFLRADIENQLGFSASLSTVYFGGGTPALCNLKDLLLSIGPRLANGYEFTVELNPLDVDNEMLNRLRSYGVNRISMGVESLDDATLAAMGRNYTVQEAAAAFRLVKRHFKNAGIDLIVGLPGDDSLPRQLPQLADWGLTHCSVYSLQNERRLKGVPTDEWILDRIKETSAFLKTLGLERYEISNYAKKGYECRYNLAVWRGEDYLGIGDGSCGRQGLKRTRCVKDDCAYQYHIESVTKEFDIKERALFQLRTREGIDPAAYHGLREKLEREERLGMVVRSGKRYCLTERGTEVCDAILANLV